MNHAAFNRHITTDELFEYLRCSANNTDPSTSTHVLSCTRCAAEVQQLRTQVTLLDATLPPISRQSASAMVSAALQAHPPIVSMNHTSRRRRWTWAVMGAITACTIGFFTGQYLQTTSLSEEPAVATLYHAASRQLLAVPEFGRDLQVPNQTQWHLELGTTTKIDLFSKSTVQLHERTTLKKHIFLKSGTIKVAVHHRRFDEQIHIKTPHGTIQVTGTVFYVRVKPDKTQVGVVHGRVTFRSAKTNELSSVSTGQVLTIGAQIPNAQTSRVDAPMASHFFPTSPRRQNTQLPSSPITKASDTITTRPKKRAPESQLTYDDVEVALTQQNFTRAETLLIRLTASEQAYRLTLTAWFELARLRERHLNNPSGAIQAYQRYIDLGGNTAPLYGEAIRALKRLTAKATRPYS